MGFLSPSFLNASFRCANPWSFAGSRVIRSALSIGANALAPPVPIEAISEPLLSNSSYAARGYRKGYTRCITRCRGVGRGPGR